MGHDLRVVGAAHHAWAPHEAAQRKGKGDQQGQNSAKYIDKGWNECKKEGEMIR